VKRLLACLFAAFLVAGLWAPVVSAASRPAKVVIVVGPTGPGMTDRFRAQATEAARIARQYTSDVTVIASPNATWPRVKKALQDASVVVYMGHGNGWPSRYRDDLFPPTQNGFGLNPVAGGSDSQHQYFGEQYVGDQIKLAKNAVVLLHHLCYASGNTEPGLSEGTLAQARQRVDNYAAGFIRAGAAAVSADAYSSPAYMIRSVLQGRRSINSIWRHAPSANGHVFGFQSQRSPGFIAQMDPDRGSSGFHRSIVLRDGLASKDVLAHARGRSSAAPGQTAEAETEAVEPTLVGQGISVEAPKVRGMTTAGAERLVRLPLEVKDRDKLPEKLKASVRWDPIDVAVVPADPANEVAADEEEAAPEASPEASAEPEAAPEASAEPSAEPEASAEPTASGDPAASDDTSAATAATAEATDGATATTAAGNDEGALPAADAGAPAPSQDPGGDTPVTTRTQPEPTPVEAPPVPDAPPDEVLLVQPEQIGDVVQPVSGSYKKYGVDFKVTMPKAAGLYRLTVTLHDPDGVAYDAATQALLSPMLVRVVGPFDAKVLATETATLESGTNVALPVRVANLGTATWGEAGAVDHGRRGGGTQASAARVVGHWVALDAASTTLAPVRASLPAALEPGSTTDASLDLAVPVAPGQYLLVLDVVTPTEGSLASIGVPPTIVRVTVVPAP